MRRALVITAVLAGCGARDQSVLDAVGPQAARSGHLLMTFMVPLAIVWVLAVGATLLAVAARAAPATDRMVARRRRIIAVAAGLTSLVLMALLAADVSTGQALATLGADEDPLHIDVTGRQWWWEIQYPGEHPAEHVITANELHLPAGKTVALRLRSQDVIHSLWIPNLAGKRDLIPGRTSTLFVRADRPGVYRGQCAEFCGQAHAQMALVVVVDTPEAFAGWLAAQRRPAPAPADDAQRRGLAFFVQGPCAMCHAVTGTDATARNGPDLTHLRSRLTLAAATAAATHGLLETWILDPQQLKPGAHMPAFALPHDQLADLLAYLETLR